MVSMECNSLICLSRRKHGPDRGPCLLAGGLHSPDTRPHPAELKGLCPSRPEGAFTALASFKKKPKISPSLRTSVSSLYRFHTWVFVPVRKWGRPGCGSWSTRPSCLWHTGPITASAGGRCSCRSDGRDQSYVFLHPPSPTCWLFILTHTAVLHQKKGTLVQDKHADIFVLITARTLRDLCGGRPETGDHARSVCHGKWRLWVFMCLWKRLRRCGPHTHCDNVEDLRPPHRRNLFPLRSRDPPGKDKHNSMIRFILVDVISRWHPGDGGSSSRAGTIQENWARVVFPCKRATNISLKNLRLHKLFFLSGENCLMTVFITACHSWIYWYFQIWIKVLLLQYYMSVCRGANQF